MLNGSAASLSLDDALKMFSDIDQDTLNLLDALHCMKNGSGMDRQIFDRQHMRQHTGLNSGRFRALLHASNLYLARLAKELEVGLGGSSIGGSSGGMAKVLELIGTHISTLSNRCAGCKALVYLFHQTAAAAPKKFYQFVCMNLPLFLEAHRSVGMNTPYCATCISLGIEFAATAEEDAQPLGSVNFEHCWRAAGPVLAYESEEVKTLLKILLATGDADGAAPQVGASPVGPSQSQIHVLKMVHCWNTVGSWMYAPHTERVAVHKFDRDHLLTHKWTLDTNRELPMEACRPYLTLLQACPMPIIHSEGAGFVSSVASIEFRAPRMFEDEAYLSVPTKVLGNALTAFESGRVVRRSSSPVEQDAFTQPDMQPELDDEIHLPFSPSDPLNLP